MEAVITAYSAKETCIPEQCIMANGKRPVAGQSVACPRNIKFGTQIIIMGKVWTCEDRTALRYDGRYDLFMVYDEEAYKKAKEFGKQYLEVIIY